MTEKMVIGGISPQKKRKNRFNLYDEAGEFAFSLSGGYPYLSKTGGKVA